MNLVQVWDRLAAEDLVEDTGLLERFLANPDARVEKKTFPAASERLTFNPFSAL